MGVDAALAAADRSAQLEVEAIVVELLPNAGFRLKLEDERRVLAHAAGATVKNFVRLRPGDRVKVVLSPHDPTRGRITELITKE